MLPLRCPASSAMRRERRGGRRLQKSLADFGKQAVHDTEVLFGLRRGHDERGADADDFAGERAEEVDSAALVVAVVAGFDASLGDLFGGRVADGSAFDAPDDAFAADVGNAGQLAELEQTTLDNAG